MKGLHNLHKVLNSNFIIVNVTEKKTKTYNIYNQLKLNWFYQASFILFRSKKLVQKLY